MVTTDLPGERTSPSEQPSDALLGTVTKVWTRTTTDDSEAEVADSVGTFISPDEVSNHEASVLLHSNAEHLRRVPIHQSFVDSAAVPKVDDFVRVEFLKSVTSAPIITGYAPNDEDRAPLARSGHWRYRFDTGDDSALYVEAERSDHENINIDDSSPYDILRLAKKPDGLSDPTTEIVIDDSESSTEVRLETDGDITISAGGDVVIDEGGTTRSVAIQDHTHDYEDDNGTSTTTKTTNTPNESGTKTEIE